MTKLNASTPVKRGYYFSLKHWSINPVEKDGAVLAGEPGEQFIPVALPVAVLLAPIMGAVFLMFMPFIGFYLTAQAAFRPVARLFRKESAELAATVAPGWVPGTAHLTGKAGDGQGPAKGEAAAGEVDALQAEVEARRSEKR